MINVIRVRRFSIRIGEPELTVGCIKAIPFHYDPITKMFES